MLVLLLTTLVSLAKASIAYHEGNASPLLFEPAHSKQEFCEQAQNLDYFKNLLRDPGNQMAFSNYGGMFDIGVCWWHSRFQRNATYTAIYRPDLAKPSPKQLSNIVLTLSKGLGPVQIPGYKNLYEFSRENEKQIQQSLEAWQGLDSATGDWIRGTQGSSKVSPQRMKKEMDALYKSVKNNKWLTYQMLQLEGPAAHAWMVLDIEKIDRGYRLYISDSNYPGDIATYRYQEGDTTFMIQGLGNTAMPYIQRQNEVQNLILRVKKFCQK